MNCHILIEITQCRGGWDARVLLDGEDAAFWHGSFTREDAIRRVVERFRMKRKRRFDLRRKGPRKDVRRLRQAATVMRREGFAELALTLDRKATELAARC